MQIRSQRLELENVNLEIEKSYTKNRKEKREQERRMADIVTQRAQARALQEYGVLSLTGS